MGKNRDKLKTSLQIFRIRDFRFYLFSRLLFVIAVQMQAVVVGWQVYEITKDPLALGMIGLAEALPSIAVALYAGHLADMIPRKRIAMSAVFVLVVCSLLLWYFSWDNQRLLLEVGTYPIYLVIILSGFARGFIAPSLFAFMTQIVPRELYPQSAAWSGTSFQIGAVTGPALGGLVYGFYGVSFAYALDLGFIALSMLFLSLVAGKPLPVENVKEKLRSSLLSGLKFVLKNQYVLGAMSLDMFAVLFGGAVALLPIFAAEILHVGSEGLGLLRAAPSIGAVGMALYLSQNPPLANSGKILLRSVVGFGVCMIVFGISSNFFLSFFALLLSGAFDSISVIIRSTIMQVMTPDNMRGRVSSVNKIFIGSSNEIGAFESGVTAKFMGAVGSVLFGGSMTLVVVAIARKAFPKLATLELKDHV
ncbi:MAG: MFS transporter [Leptospira sp.]|jgi:MFS family permease|nr:MFS transporter [Leptospira sp.]